MIAFPDFWTGFVLSATVWLGCALAIAWLLRGRPAQAHCVLVAATLASAISPVLWLAVQWADWGLLPPVSSARAVPEALAGTSQSSVNRPIGGSADPALSRASGDDHRTSRPVAFHPVVPSADVQPIVVAPGMQALQDSQSKVGLNESQVGAPARVHGDLPPADESIVRESKSVLGSFPWMTLAAWIWMAWSLASFTKLIWDLARAGLAVSRCAEPAVPSLCESLKRTALRLGLSVRLPQIRQSEWVGSPSLWAWGTRPTILVGPDFSGDAHADAIFCHELAHWARRDHLGTLAGELLFCLLPWHPLVWLTRSAIKRYSEEACDDWTIESGCSVTDYAEALLGIAAGKPLRMSLPAVSPRSHLGDRVRRILAEGFRPNRIARGWLVGAGIVTVALLVVVALLRRPSGTSEIAEDLEFDGGANGPVALAIEPKEKADQVTTARKPLPESTHLNFVDEAGKPVAGVKIEGRSLFAENVGGKRSYKTEKVDQTSDANGLASFDLKKDYRQFDFYIKKEGYIGIHKIAYIDDDDKSITILPNYKIVLEKGSIIGGLIKDDKNRPIKNAKIVIGCSAVYNDNETSLGALKTMDGAATYSANWERMTDDAGYWEVKHFPMHPLAKAWISVTHPDFLPAKSSVNGEHGVSIKMNELREAKAVIQLGSGFHVKGKVTDPNGKPISGVRAATMADDAPYWIGEDVRFEANGFYRSITYKQGRVQLSVAAPGFGPQTRMVRLDSGLADQDFVLQPRGALRVKLVDSEGKPIPKVSIYPKGNGLLDELLNHNHRFSWEQSRKDPADKSDPNGEWIWTWPNHEENEIQIGELGEVYSGRGSWEPTIVTLKAGDPLKTVVLKEVKPIVGRVTDARTGKPITRFSLAQLHSTESGKFVFHAFASTNVESKDGEFSSYPVRNDQALRLRIQAPGYHSQDGPEFQVGRNAPSPQNFALQVAAPIRAKVVDSTGKAMAKLGVHYATSSRFSNVYSHRPDFITDENGHFAFDPPNEPFTLLIRGSSGSYTGTFSPRQADLGTLMLTAPARIKGTLFFNNEPVARTSVTLSPVPFLEAGQRIFREQGHMTMTDAQGRFEFPAVTPGAIEIEVPLWNSEPVDCRSSEQRGLIAYAGQETDVVLGRNGIQLTGNIQIGTDRSLDLSEAVVHLFRRTANAPTAIDLAWFHVDRHGINPDSSRKKIAYHSSHQYWVGKVTKEGGFHFSGIPEGEYDLLVKNEPYARWERPFFAYFVRKVSITAQDLQAGKRFLPLIQGPVVARTATGSKPSLSFRKADGQQGSLADFQGQFLFVVFRSEWADDDHALENTLETLSKKYGPEGIRILEIDLNQQPAAPAAGREIKNPSIKGRLIDPGDLPWGWTSHSWFIDPSGVLLSEYAGLEDIEKVLKHFKK